MMMPGDLLAIEAIKQTKARYFRALDTKDWALMGEQFTEDAACDFRGADTDPSTGIRAVPGATDVVLRGKEQIVGSLRAGLEASVSVHMGYMPEIDVTGLTQARGIWAMTDVLRFPAGPIAEMTGAGHYHELYRRVDGRWLIESLRLTRLSLQVVGRAPA